MKIDGVFLRAERTQLSAQLESDALNCVETCIADNRDKSDALNNFEVRDSAVIKVGADRAILISVSARELFI